MYIEQAVTEIGAPGGIRTHDPCLRRAVLYPAELLVQRATSYLGRLGASMPGLAGFVSVRVGAKSLHSLKR